MRQHHGEDLCEEVAKQRGIRDCTIDARGTLDAQLHKN